MNTPLIDLIADSIAATAGKLSYQQQAEAVVAAIEGSGRRILLENALRTAIKEQPKPEDVAKKVALLLLESGHTNENLRDLLIKVIGAAWDDYCGAETTADKVLIALASADRRSE